MAKSYSLKATAELLDITQQWVIQLVKKGVIPSGEKGKYDAVACNHAYIRYLRKLAEGSGSESLVGERVRLTKAQAGKAELELKIAKGEYVHYAIPVKIAGKMLMAFRSRILWIPVKAAPLLENKQKRVIKSELERMICDALTELSGLDPAHFITEIKTEVSGTASKTNNKRMVRQKQKVKPRVKR